MAIPAYCNINIIHDSQDQIFTAIMAKVKYLKNRYPNHHISQQQQQELKTLSWQIAKYSRIDYNQKTSVCNVLLDYDKYEFKISMLQNNNFLIDNSTEDLIYHIIFETPITCWK